MDTRLAAETTTYQFGLAIIAAIRWITDKGTCSRLTHPGSVYHILNYF
jgi:hypothetical protein